MDTLEILAGIILTLFAYGVIEMLAHRRRLAQIPIRVHVNGTRGKSSVTRLIAAGLRASGKRVCAKTTGTLARMIFPDGSEYPVFRSTRPNIIEQVRIIETAASVHAEAIVIECMALQPAYQWICESKLVRATHGVITNARADHLEVMGPTEVDVAKALAGMVPPKGLLFTAEQRHLNTFKDACADRAARLIETTPEDISHVTDEEMAGFKYVEHKENVALALRVCKELGVERRRALEGMWKANPDPGVMTEHHIHFFGRNIDFVNGFAANDPESTERIWDLAIARYPRAKRKIAIFNCRYDRPERSVQLAQACVHWQPADTYVLIGTGTYIFATHAARAGLDPLKLVFAEERQVDELFEILVDLCDHSALIMGMGNIGGPGLELVRYFRNRGEVITGKALVEAA